MYVRTMIETARIADLDGDAACAALGEARAALVTAEVRELYLAAHWADLHDGDALEDEGRRSGRRALPGMERGKRVGADGTPLVAEFAAMELGAMIGVGYVSASTYLRDALNLRHRHPAMWAALGRALSGDAAFREGLPRVWQARTVSRMCAEAGLDLEQARWVDAVTTPYLASLPYSRFVTLVEAKIIEADPVAADERRRAAEMARFVRTGQSSEYGLKLVVAKAAAGDVIFFVAMLDRLAQILALRGDTDPVDVRRSKAIGILATPARALRMLEETEEVAPDRARAEPPGRETSTGGNDRTNTKTDEPADSPGGSPEGGVGDTPEDEAGHIVELDVHPSQNDADDPSPCPTCGGESGASTGDATPFTKPAARDPRRLLPNATLYIHLSEESLRSAMDGRERPSSGVARLEGVGPITVEQVREFLRHTNVRVVPVLDLAGQSPVDGYEVPDRMQDALHLRNPACISPWGTNLSRRKDMEHVRPYLPPDEGGPPGQTSMENLGPLSRFPHRVKTHGRWRLRQPGPGVFEWRSPHGYRFRVDHDGTHALDKERTREVDAPTPGLMTPAPVTSWDEHGEIYEPAFSIELDWQAA
jgi:hypothetical protein